TTNPTNIECVAVTTQIGTKPGRYWLIVPQTIAGVIKRMVTGHLPPPTASAAETNKTRKSRSSIISPLWSPIKNGYVTISRTSATRNWVMENRNDPGLDLSD